MNPSFAPTSEPQWGLVGHCDDPANISAHSLTASPVPDMEGPEGPHVCQQCGKQYPRLCDLNKHLKAHTRPFKCPVEACKYHLLGWPTEKELDRHRNDKHSMEPRTYSCLYPPCTCESIPHPVPLLGKHAPRFREHARKQPTNHQMIGRHLKAGIQLQAAHGKDARLGVCSQQTWSQGRGGSSISRLDQRRQQAGHPPR